MSPGKKSGEIKKFLDITPRNRNDYIPILFWKVGRKLAAFMVAGIFLLCGGALLFLWASGVFAKGSPVFPYDSVFLSVYSGKADILARDGHLAYRGEIKEGAADGEGKLWDEKGEVVYEGGFENSRYSGQGILYGSGGVKKYEGGFLEGRYSGQGILYDAGGSPVYTGNFRNGRIVYEELTGTSTGEIAEKYSGRQILYLWGGETYLLMDGIDAMYLAVTDEESLDEEWTTDGVYVFQNTYPAGTADGDKNSLLREYFGEPAYNGLTRPDLGYVLAGSIWNERSEAGEENLPQIRAQEIYTDTFQVSGWDETYWFWITAYEKEGLRYTFFSDPKEQGNGGFWFYLIERSEPDLE